jgi:hypothetical protein
VLERRDPAVAAAVAALHAAAACIVLARGFDHVSDDDFARVTIAQAFAHAPRLDPSGTSWLPFPFWWMGAWMAAFGRTLAVARVASIALASLSSGLAYLALRTAGVTRGRALAGLAFALLSPWSLWLGAATVPESFTATAIAASAVALAARPSAPFAALLAAACLSRYEAWPVAATVAVVLALRARDADDRRAHLVAAAIAAIAPLAWMAWNAHAHGSPVHFFHRVSSFKRAIGEGSSDTTAALLLYPRLLLKTRPELAAAALLGLLALRDEDVRRRWLVPLACIGAQLAFLAIGNARDGAPAHHPERALLGVTVLAAMFAVDACSELPSRFVTSQGRAAVGFGLVLLWAWSSARVWEGPPGASASEDRRAQLTRGRELEARGVRALTVVPCAFEHFALLAAYGAPENATIEPKTGAPVGPECPRVEAH